MTTVNRTATLYLQPDSRDWPESDWTEAARWEREALVDRPTVVVGDQRLIQWGTNPRIETDYTIEPTGEPARIRNWRYERQAT